jgi:RNA polymerase sigma-70 factor (ECF subfamily)
MGLSKFMEEDILLSQQGDGEAYRRLIDEYSPHVARMMWRFTRETAEHEILIQDVFVEVWLALPRYKPLAPFVHWLSRIATRTGYAYWKRQKKQGCEVTLSQEASQILADPASEEAFERLNVEHSSQLAYELLAKLPPRDRLILTLRFVEEKSVEETAELCGWTQVMVKVQTWRARKKLQKLFNQLKMKEKQTGGNS